MSRPERLVKVAVEDCQNCHSPAETAKEENEHFVWCRKCLMMGPNAKGRNEAARVWNRLMRAIRKGTK